VGDSVAMVTVTIEIVTMKTVTMETKVFGARMNVLNCIF